MTAVDTIRTERYERELILRTIQSVLAQLRHAYDQLHTGDVRDQPEFARGLIAPQIKALEQIEWHGESVKALLDNQETIAKTSQELRRMLWLRHGCPTSAQYGDDGEMQCNACMIDFKRDSLQNIQDQWTRIAHEKTGTGNVVKRPLNLYPK